MQRRFFSILAAAGLLLLVLQLVDLAPMISEADLTTSAGRVRVVTLLQGRAFPILLADVSLVWTTIALSRPGAVRVIGALHFMLGALMVLVAPFFLVDAGRLAGAISGGQVSAFRIIVARTLVVLGVLGGCALVAGRLIWRLGRQIPAAG